MTSFEETLNTACKDGRIRGAVAIARDKSGLLRSAQAFGSYERKPNILTLLFLGLCHLCLEGKQDWALRFLGKCARMTEMFTIQRPCKPMVLDAMMALASCTKLLTSIAAMQCVERGIWNLDDDVGPILPELAGLEILTGFDATGNPIFKKRETPITLRHLLTHTAGLSYDSHPLLMRYRKRRQQKLHTGKNIQERFGVALVYEPGTSWRYSPGLDWAGKLIERLTHQTLEMYFRTNLAAPLEADYITFFALDRVEFKSRMPGLSVRIPSGPLLPCPFPPLLSASSDCEGGGGCYASMLSYSRILESLLLDDEKLLRKATAAQLFEPQLNDAARQAMAVQMSEPDFVGHLPPHVGWDHGLGGIVSMSDDGTWRRKGTMIWTGLFNLIWFVDRTGGLCGVFGTQILPSADPAITELATLFQKTMYERAARKET